MALALLCYVLVLQSENMMISDDSGQSDQSEANISHSDPSEASINHADQSEASIRLTDQSESSIQFADQSEARVSRLRSVCAGQPPSPPPPGPGVETVLLPGHPPVTVCVPHKVGHWSIYTSSLTIDPGWLSRLGGVQQEAGGSVPGEDGEAAVPVLESEGRLGQEGGGGEASPGQAGQRLQDDLPGIMQ